MFYKMVLFVLIHVQQINTVQYNNSFNDEYDNE